MSGGSSFTCGQKTLYTFTNVNVDGGFKSFISSEYPVACKIPIP